MTRFTVESKTLDEIVKAKFRERVSEHIHTVWHDICEEHADDIRALTTMEHGGRAGVSNQVVFNLRWDDVIEVGPWPDKPNA